MLKFRLIIALIIASFLFSCGPSKLEQTVAEGKRNLEERQEQDRIKAQVESDAAERRWQQTLVEMKRKQESEAELARQQAEYDYKLSLLDAENRKVEIENELRKTEITSKNELRKVEIESENELRKAEIESKKEIRITEIQSQSEIEKYQIQAYERITTEQIKFQANVEEARLLAIVGVEQERMQALVGAVQMRLDSKTKSEEIEADRQIEIAKTITSTQIVQTEGVARIEAEAAVAIIDRISQAKTEEELVKHAATVALFSQY